MRYQIYSEKTEFFVKWQDYNTDENSYIQEQELMDGTRRLLYGYKRQNSWFERNIYYKSVTSNIELIYVSLDNIGLDKVRYFEAFIIPRILIHTTG